MTDPDRLAFSLDLLAHADRSPRPLSFCPDGHLVVNGNTHWQPERFDTTGRALVCRIAVHEDT